MTATVHAFPLQRHTVDDIVSAANRKCDALRAYMAARTDDNRAALIEAHRDLLTAQHRGDAAQVAEGMRRFERDLNLAEELP